VATAELVVHHNSKMIDAKWMQDFWLNELTEEELIKWIKNTSSYINSKTGYYQDVELIDMPKTKMIEWVGYHIYFKPFGELDDDEQIDAITVLQKIEKKINWQFKTDVDNEDIYFLTFGKNRMETVYTPAIMYGALNLVKNAAYRYMAYSGFAKYKTKKADITYFHYHDSDTKPTSLFIHGLGVGITPYLPFIMSLMEHTNLLVLVLPNISNMEYSTNLFPEYEAIRSDITDMLDDHNLDKVNMIGHSFGTIIMGIILNDPNLSNRIDKKVFIDPVCFIDSSYKIFRYINEPDDRDGGVVNNVFNMLVYKDIYVRYATQRFLFGPEFWLLDYNRLNDNNSLVFLSMLDQIVPSESIYSRMIKYGVPCVVINDAQHADVFLNDGFNDVLDKVVGYIKKFEICSI
jgi:hypothetical protein